MGNASTSQAESPSSIVICQYCSCDIDLKTRQRQCPRCHGRIERHNTSNNHHQQQYDDGKSSRRGSRRNSLSFLDRLTRNVSSMSSSSSTTATGTLAAAPPPPPTKSNSNSNSNRANVNSPEKSPLNNNNSGRTSQWCMFLEHVHIAPFGSTLSDMEEKEINDELLINSLIKPYFSSPRGQRERIKSGSRFVINNVEFKVYCCYPPEGM